MLSFVFSVELNYHDYQPTEPNRPTQPNPNTHTNPKPIKPNQSTQTQLTNQPKGTTISSGGTTNWCARRRRGRARRKAGKGRKQGWRVWCQKATTRTPSCRTRSVGVVLVLVLDGGVCYRQNMFILVLQHDQHHQHKHRHHSPPTSPLTTTITTSKQNKTGIGFEEASAAQRPAAR